MKIYKNRHFFSLLEVAIVLSCLSIILSAVVAGRSIRTNSMVVSTMNDVEKYKKAVSSFYIQNNCLPANCGNAFTSKLDYKYQSLKCLDTATSVYLTENENAFSSSNAALTRNITKSICAWMELQSSNFIPANTVNIYNDSSILSQSRIPPVGVAGYHVPSLKPIKGTVIFLLTQNCNSSNCTSRIAPAAMSYQKIYPYYKDRHFIVTSFSDQFDGSPVYNNNTSSIPMYDTNSLSAKLAPRQMSSKFVSMLDAKYDDGLPYSGKIFADRDGALRADGSDVDSGCVKNVGSRSWSATKSSDGTYNSSEGINLCNVAFLIDGI